MKKLLCAVLTAALLCGCAAAPAVTTGPAESTADAADRWMLEKGGLEILVPGGMAENAITAANDIVCYEAGHGADYGEGEEHEAHTAEEAAAHTVVHITRPGTYILSGKLSLGQIAVDLGEDAKNDPNAVVTLILDGLDITCQVAPAIIFYNVYECGDPEHPKADVDTSAAGANVILAEGSENRVVGSHVAKIYKPGTEKKLHKYDAAFYSRMSMNIGGEGSLHIEADNEGLDSEMHLTINGGEISIESGNDGINTNEDGVSVTTVNGGSLYIQVTGGTGEGDGIDSNGWLVINGGTVEAYACSSSGDSGIDSDMGIEINGGTVISTGNMLDQIDENSQTHLVFTFAESQQLPQFTLKDSQGTTVLQCQTPNAFTNLLLSSPDIAEGTYTLWAGDTQFEGVTGNGSGFFGQFQPIDRPDFPDFPGNGEGGDVEIPPQPTTPIVTQGTVQPPPPGEQPENMPVPQFPQGGEGQMPTPPIPEGSGDMPMPELPDGVTPPQDGGGRQPNQIVTGVLSTEFAVTRGANYFMNVRAVQK